MKTWLILIYLATTVISSFSQVADDGQVQQEETPFPTQNAGTDEESEGNWTWVLNFFKVISGDKDKENAEETIKTATEEQKEVSPEKEETTNLNVTCNGIQGEEENNGITTACKPTARASTTAKPTTVPTTAETTTESTCLSKNCQPRSNPWAACTHPTPKDEMELSEALTEFAIEFYKTAIRQESRDSNFVFSPSSISTILSILLLGACDETKVRLEKLLSYPEDFTCVHKALKSLSKSEALISANAIFYQPELTMGSDFLNQSEMFYKTKFAPLTKNSNQDVVEINAWVNKNTNYKIKKLLDDLDPDVQMVLLNAVYFHSKWKTVFKLKHTKEEEFYRPGLPPILVPMMTSKKYPVASFFDTNLQAKVARLQLFHNMSLIIIVPYALSLNLSEVEERLTPTVFKSVVDKLERVSFKPTILTLPKFKVESSQDLMALIGEMDYGIFFDANLCGISQDEEMAVSGAQHKAVIEISEEGVEAAAATGVSLARTANYFEVQQPFMFSVVKDGRNVVFMGRINNPQL
ncbi:plasma protease C1 inhibitor isoform X2 [Elgaria multicarinata webbii]|uniref:plasma protease C1 inhibitor isoform X2 n=1 Tax=Elgaria multicarinata webbii TaxID=159646 RepID=UPI002FCD3FAF